jgi:hypothetical protein
MNTQELLAIWRDRKLQRHFYKLVTPFETEYKFQKQTNHGHFAFVRFNCNPANDLSFRVADDAWPSTLPPSYRPIIEFAIEEGIVDALFCSLNPHRGCQIVLTNIGWNDIDSNEAAFYNAAKMAIENLLTKGNWK